MKRISILGLGVLVALASAPARAQDFTAGKTPAQLFGSDCSECHRTPNGLAKNRDAKTLAGFLREHYTTKPETAGSLASYVLGYVNGGPADVRNRAGNGPSPPSGNDRPDRRNRDTAAVGDDARNPGRTPDEQAARRRRATNQSGDGEKRRRPDEGGAPAIQTAARTGEPPARDTTDPAARLRSYVFSGLGIEGTVAEAAKAGSGRSRKRQGGEVTAEMPIKTGADGAAASTSPSEPASAAAPTEGSPTMPTLAPPPAPAAPAAVVTPPRLGQ